MKPKVEDIAYGTSKPFLNGPKNTRCGKYLTNGIWLIEEKYVPSKLLNLKQKVKLKHKPKKSVVKEIFKNKSKAQDCILIGKITEDGIENHKNVKIICYKYTFHSYRIPRSRIKRRKIKIDQEVLIQAKYINYFKPLVEIRMNKFNLKAYRNDEQVYIYSGDKLIGAIMPLLPGKRIIKRRKKINEPLVPEGERLDHYDDIPF